MTLPQARMTADADIQSGPANRALKVRLLGICSDARISTSHPCSMNSMRLKPSTRAPTSKRSARTPPLPGARNLRHSKIDGVRNSEISISVTTAAQKPVITECALYNSTRSASVDS